MPSSRVWRKKFLFFFLFFKHFQCVCFFQKYNIKVIKWLLLKTGDRRIGEAGALVACVRSVPRQPFVFEWQLLGRVHYRVDREANTFDEFKTVVLQNGGEFSDSHIVNLLCLIKHMKAASSETKGVNMHQVKRFAACAEVVKKPNFSLDLPSLMTPISELRACLKQSNPTRKT